VTQHEPEIRRAKARLYVASCNRQMHEAPWTTGRTSTASGGGVYLALELAGQASEVHGLAHKPDLSNMHVYDPRRFTWVYDEGGEAENCVKVRDNETGRLAVWPHWAG
jgi:hypothetical protein